jgi:hypothetical protein
VCLPRPARGALPLVDAQKLPCDFDGLVSTKPRATSRDCVSLHGAADDASRADAHSPREWGGLGRLHSSPMWLHPDPWARTLRKILESRLGPVRSLDVAAEALQRCELTMRGLGYTPIEHWEHTYQSTIDIDFIIGHISSALSPAQIPPEQRPGLEEQVRQKIAAIAPSSSVTETVAVRALIGHIPPTAMHQPREQPQLSLRPRPLPPQPSSTLILIRVLSVVGFVIPPLSASRGAHRRLRRGWRSVHERTMASNVGFPRRDGLVSRDIAVERTLDSGSARRSMGSAVRVRPEVR